MRRPIATRPSPLTLLLAACGLLCLALAACNTPTSVRGDGSERWQSLRVGLPF
jgi:hypothetical protein